MRRFVVIAFAFLLCGCGGGHEPPQRINPTVRIFRDFTAGTFKYLLRDMHYEEASKNIEIDGTGAYRYVLSEGPGAYEVAFDIEDSVNISRVTFRAYSPTSSKFGGEMAGWIASIPFEGADQRGAMRWAKENWGSNTQSNIGQGKYELTKSPEGNTLVIVPLFGFGEGAR